EEQGNIRRTHGGAAAASSEDELPFMSKLTLNLAEKWAIGSKTAALIPEGSVIACTGGTTVLGVVKALKDKTATVITNAINIAMELAPSRSIEVIVTGGTLRPRSYELVGHIADGTLENFHFDIALIGVDGFSIEHGLSTYTLSEAHTAALYIAKAESVWVVADHDKIGKVMPALIAPIGKIHRLITDPGIGEADRMRIQSSGIDLVIAEL
ncbi:MAG: DeoR/GlpR family DNA-binding transcription regulator, partial [Spirochaetaceae bacterium]|nr:DeoR/GlpR family DNA-binding transcription regulator [Spirochaetaceae bacterium]